HVCSLTRGEAASIATDNDLDILHTLAHDDWMALSIVDRIFRCNRRLVATSQGNCETASDQQPQRRSTLDCLHLPCPIQSRIKPYLPRYSLVGLTSPLTGEP